jgi:hypothetical protein
MRNDGVGEMGRHRVGEKEGKNGSEYVTRGIASKYSKIFAKESDEICYPGGFLFALLESQDSSHRCFTFFYLVQILAAA